MNDENWTKKVQVEVEVGAIEKLPNRFSKIIDLAEAFDSWRVFPRLFICFYLVLLYNTTNWFIALEDPTMPQAGLISTVIGAGAAWFGLYVNTGSSNNKGK